MKMQSHKVSGENADSPEASNTGSLVQSTLAQGNFVNSHGSEGLPRFQPNPQLSESPFITPALGVILRDGLSFSSHLRTSWGLRPGGISGSTGPCGSPGPLESRLRSESVTVAQLFRVWPPGLMPHWQRGVRRTAALGPGAPAKTRK